MNQRSQKQARIHYKNVQTPWGYNKVPWLNLSGAWLKDAGFDISDAITISISRKKIVVKKIGRYCQQTKLVTTETFIPDEK